VGATPVGEAPARFSTVGLPEDERIALWEDHNADALIGLRCRTLGESSLEATELNLQLERIHLARVTGNPHVVERAPEVIRSHPADAIAVYVTLVGEAFFYHDDGVRTLRPGQLLICDADRPFMRGFSHGLEELAIKVPRVLFAELTGLPALTSPLVRDFTHGDVQARTLATMVGGAMRREGAQSVDEEAVLHLIASLARGRGTDSSAAYLHSARAFIEDHLTDPGLSADRVAQGIGISERQLSRVFATTDTSLPQYILGRRLERAHLLLRSSPELPIGGVAARCGFGSAAHFSHSFRQRFEVRAAEVRRQARTRGQP
jgi:AraC-like DNA-binding protein